jgi:hypothetical protein
MAITLMSVLRTAGVIGCFTAVTACNRVLELRLSNDGPREVVVCVIGNPAERRVSPGETIVHSDAGALLIKDATDVTRVAREDVPENRIYFRGAGAFAHVHYVGNRRLEYQQYDLTSLSETRKRH